MKRKHTPQEGFQLGHKPYKGCEKGWFKKGQKPWNKGTKGLIMANSGSFKKGEHRSKKTEFKKGEKPWNYKGGFPNCVVCGKELSQRKSKTNKCLGCIMKNKKKKEERNDSMYQWWVKQIKKRDKNKCAFKGQNCSGYCIVHHILPWRDYPELRYEIKNGITLCQHHHPKKRIDEQKLIPFFQEMVMLKELI